MGYAPINVEAGTRLFEPTKDMNELLRSLSAHHFHEVKGKLVFVQEE